jgi:hypothetical protein
MNKERRITNYDWSRYEEGKVNYKPTKMSEEELLEGIRYVASEYFSVKQSLKRSFNRYNLNPVNGIVSFLGDMSIRYFYKHEKLGI